MENTPDGGNSRCQYPEAVQPTESSPLWLKQDKEGKNGRDELDEVMEGPCRHGKDIGSYCEVDAQLLEDF